MIQFQFIFSPEFGVTFLSRCIRVKLATLKYLLIDVDVNLALLSVKANYS